jgi:hypothetical protein
MSKSSNVGVEILHDELQTIVVCPDCEWPSPQVGLLVADSFGQANELAFICRQLLVMCCHRPAEEANGSISLVENSTEPQLKHVIIHDEALGEVRHLKQGCGHESLLELCEGILYGS